MAATRWSAPSVCSSATPPGHNRCVEIVSAGKLTRSSATTRRPARANAIAVAEPAQRAPTITASACSADVERIWLSIAVALRVDGLHLRELRRLVQLVHLGWLRARARFVQQRGDSGAPGFVATFHRRQVDVG